MLNGRQSPERTGGRAHGLEDMPADTRFRILVLDEDPHSVEHIDNSLWIWRHTVSAASSVNEAIRMCWHLQPTAIIAAVNFRPREQHNVIRTLRRQLPGATVVALVSPDDAARPGMFLDDGADAVLSRDDLQRPALHQLLVRLRQSDSRTHTSSPRETIPRPWRDSAALGALICSIDGRILNANRCLEKWLNYGSDVPLRGRNVRFDILDSENAWAEWKSVAGDADGQIHQQISVKTRGRQHRWMAVDVIAAPHSPTDILASFVDRTDSVFAESSLPEAPAANSSLKFQQ